MTNLIQEGSRDAKIILVGEAPGETEERTGRPFQVGDGEILNRILENTDIERRDCFITNLCHVRPPGNKFEWFYAKANQGHYFAGVLQLKRDIETIKPNLVVALGAHPLRALTGKFGIDKWRGSILPSTIAPGVKVIGTYHPSFCLRVYPAKAVSEIDFNRVRIEGTYPDIRRPRRDHYLHPPAEERERLSAEMERAEWLAIDIECWQDKITGRWKLACVGFSDRADRSLVIHNDGPAAIHSIRRLCMSPTKKVMQNGTFDVTVLKEEGIEVTNFVWDTMLAHHARMPECASGDDEMSAQSGKKKRTNPIKKGLAFQASIYTTEPFYKDDGKMWQETGDLKTFWLYNSRDAAVTREIRDVQERELREFDTTDIFHHEMALVAPCMAVADRGFRINLAVRDELKKTLDAEITRLQAFIDNQAGFAFNAKSPKQVQALLYDVLKLPKRHKKRADGSSTVTADKDAINDLAERNKHPVLLGILKVRERRDLVERYLSATIDSDGRMRCSIDITGTRTGRLSTRQSLHGSGTNLTTIPSRKKEGEQIRRMFIADEGKVLIVRDYSQAEVWIVAYASQCEKLIQLLGDPTRDIHKETATRIFSCDLSQVSDAQRYLAKRTVHASNYGIAGKHLAEKVNEDAEVTGIRITALEGDRCVSGYFLAYPEIKSNYWREVESELRYTRTLNTPFGRKREFFGRWDDKFLREAYSYIPQSTVGDLGAKAFVRCYNEIELGRPELEAEILLNIHDAVMMQAPIAHAETVAQLMQQVMAMPITIKGKTFVIPSDCKIGLNWSKRSNENTNGLIALDKGGREWLASLT